MSEQYEARAGSARQLISVVMPCFNASSFGEAELACLPVKAPHILYNPGAPGIQYIFACKNLVDHNEPDTAFPGKIHPAPVVPMPVKIHPVFVHHRWIILDPHNHKERTGCMIIIAYILPL